MLSSSPESLYVCLYTVLIPYLLYCTIFTLYSSVQTVCTVVIEGGGTTVQKLPLCLNSMCYQTICTVAREGGRTTVQQLPLSLNSICYQTIRTTFSEGGGTTVQKLPFLWTLCVTRLYVHLLVKEEVLQYKNFRFFELYVLPDYIRSTFSEGGGTTVQKLPISLWTPCVTIPFTVLFMYSC